MLLGMSPPCLIPHQWGWCLLRVAVQRVLSRGTGSPQQGLGMISSEGHSGDPGCREWLIGVCTAVECEAG